MDGFDNVIQCDLDGKNAQIIQINSFNMCFCQFHKDSFYSFSYVQVDDMNNEKPLIYWVKKDYIIVTDINVCMCNMILHNKDMNDAVEFNFITIDKTNIYIFIRNYMVTVDISINYFYVLEKKYALFDSVNGG